MVANTIKPPFYTPEQLDMFRQLQDAIARLQGSKTKLERDDALRSVSHWHEAIQAEFHPNLSQHLTPDGLRGGGRM